MKEHPFRNDKAVQLENLTRENAEQKDTIEEQGANIKKLQDTISGRKKERRSKALKTVGHGAHAIARVVIIVALSGLLIVGLVTCANHILKSDMISSNTGLSRCRVTVTTTDGTETVNRPCTEEDIK